MAEDKVWIGIFSPGMCGTAHVDSQENCGTPQYCSAKGVDFHNVKQIFYMQG